MSSVVKYHKYLMIFLRQRAQNGIGGQHYSIMSQNIIQLHKLPNNFPTFENSMYLLKIFDDICWAEGSRQDRGDKITSQNIIFHITFKLSVINFLLDRYRCEISSILMIFVGQRAQHRTGGQHYSVMSQNYFLQKNFQTFTNFISIS